MCPVDGRCGAAALGDASADPLVPDAYAGGRVPAELTTREAVADAARVLRLDAGRGGGMTLTEWVEAVCLDLDLDAAAVEPQLRDLLDLTREVAHGVERPAAPVTLLLLGLAAAGDPARLAALSAQVRALLPPT